MWQPAAWFRDHVRVAAECFGFVSARLWAGFLVWLVVGIALALPAGLWLLQINMEQMSAGWEGRPGLSVYFVSDATDDDIDIARQHLSGHASVESVSVTTAQEALEEFKTYSGLHEALEILEGNPLPASLIARLSTGVDTGELAALTGSAQSLAGVAEVVVEKTWLERLRDLSTLVSRLGVVLGVLFGIGATLVTASSVRLAIESRLDELRVLMMVGATRGQVRRPFLYFGGIYGFGGGVIAAMLIAVTLVVIEPPLQSLLGSYNRQLDTAGFDPAFLGFILLLGTLLGVLGALLAVRQRLRDLEIV